MIVDSLTKKLGSSNSAPLLRLMKTGRLRLGFEADEVAFRQEMKNKGRTLQRLKGKTIIDDD